MKLAIKIPNGTLTQKLRGYTYAKQYFKQEFEDMQKILKENIESDFDVVGFIMDFESGQITDDEKIIEGFQYLIDSGTINGLQGSYQRAAASLINQGLCTPAK